MFNNIEGWNGNVNWDNHESFSSQTSQTQKSSLKKSSEREDDFTIKTDVVTDLFSEVHEESPNKVFDYDEGKKICKKGKLRMGTIRVATGLGRQKKQVKVS